MISLEQRFVVTKENPQENVSDIDPNIVGYKAYNCWLLSKMLPASMTPKTLILPGELFEPFFNNYNLNRFHEIIEFEKLSSEIEQWINLNHKSTLNYIVEYFAGQPISVRSTADEDQLGCSFAGRYLSVLDVKKNDIAIEVARVLASYCSPRYLSDNLKMVCGPVMLQEMIGSQNNDVEQNYAPYIPPNELKQIARLTRNISREYFNGELIDTEWILKGDHYNISCVAFSNDPNSSMDFIVITGAFGAGKVVDGTSPTSTYYVNLENEDHIIMDTTKGMSSILPVAENFDLYALQVRPAIQVKTEKYQHTIIENTESAYIIACEVLVGKSIVIRGKVFRALTIESAWFKWKKLSKKERLKYACIAVLKGSKLDHYAILFREQSVCVVLLSASEYRNLSSHEIGNNVIVDCEQNRLLVSKNSDFKGIQIIDGPSTDLSLIKGHWDIILCNSKNTQQKIPTEIDTPDMLLKNSILIDEVRLLLEEEINCIKKYLDNNKFLPVYGKLNEQLQALNEFFSKYKKGDQAIYSASLLLTSYIEILKLVRVYFIKEDLITALFYTRILFRLYYGNDEYATEISLKKNLEILSYKGFYSVMNKAIFSVLYGMKELDLAQVLEINNDQIKNLFRTDKTYIGLLISKVIKANSKLELLSTVFSNSIRHFAKLVTCIEDHNVLTSFERKALMALSKKIETRFHSDQLNEVQTQFVCNEKALVRLAILEQELENDVFYNYSVKHLGERLSDSSLFEGISDSQLSTEIVQKIVKTCGADRAIFMIRQLSNQNNIPLCTLIIDLINTHQSSSTSVQQVLNLLQANDDSFVKPSLNLAKTLVEKITKLGKASSIKKINNENTSLFKIAQLICNNSMDTVVDLYDNAGKVLCTQLPENKSSTIDLYLFVLKSWHSSLIDIYKAMNFSVGLKRLNYFKLKIKEIEKNSSIDIGLDEHGWKSLVTKTPEKVLNFHQLHNAMHQSEMELRDSLFEIDITNDKISKLLVAANRFSPLASKIQRLEASKVELDLALSAHKSLCVLSKEEISFEFIELSSLRFNISKIIGRLYAIQYWLPIILDKKGVEWNCHIDETLKEYQLRINLYPKKNKQFSYDEILNIFSRIKTLFDGMHRFGRCSNKLVHPFKKHENSIHLKELFKLILNYNERIDYASRRTAVKRNYCGYILTYISLNPNYFENLLENLQKGFESFLQFCTTKIKAKPKFTQNYYRPWKTMNEKRVFLLFLCIKYPEEMSLAYATKRKEILIFNITEVNELLFNSRYLLERK